MPLTYPVDFPEFDGKTPIQKMTMRLKEATTMTESPFNYTQLVNTYKAARWEAEITLRPLSHAEGRTFSAFLASFRGRLNTFFLAHPLEVLPSNLTVTSSGTFQAGSTQLRIDNTQTNTDLKAGKHIAINQHIYVMLEDVDGGVSRLIDIAPHLKNQVVDNANIEVDEPKGQWRLATSNFDFDIDRASKYSFSFSCIEVI